MTRNKAFLIVSLIAMTAAESALADTTATREWVKAQVYDKYVEPMGDALNTINKRLATDVRDKIYTYDKNTKTVSNPLRTDGQNAFDGINELLTKVDGNDGTSGSAVELETTAKNAYGAINELKGEIAGLQSQVNAKVSSDDLNSAVADVVADEVAAQVGDDLDTIYDSGAQQRVSVTIVDTEDFDLDDIKPSI